MLYCCFDVFCLQEKEPITILASKFDSKKQDELKRLGNLKVRLTIKV